MNNMLFVFHWDVCELQQKNLLYVLNMTLFIQYLYFWAQGFFGFFSLSIIRYLPPWTHCIPLNVTTNRIVIFRYTYVLFELEPFYPWWIYC